MDVMQFVSCWDTECPFNAAKACMAKEISVNESGACRTRFGQGKKSEIEGYVKIAECSCSRCNNWELDEATNLGKCGLREDLLFSLIRQADGSIKKEAPKCDTFANKQISEPGFAANV